ncbi:GNAT family N-acetyltransferase [Candidatus Izimaplasma bacterium]|nr:GNAT family N-acetyltransferase [Candidatus Izimaplasma bacterium]
MMKIIELDKEKFKGYEVVFDYTTDSYYETVINQKNEIIQVSFTKKRFDEEKNMKFTSHLFKDHWEKPSAYGCYIDNQLAGLVEISRGAWDKRIRVTNIRVESAFRGMKIGSALMDKVKEICKEESYRAIILETQTFNTKAIDFYLSQGFVFGGFDASCYSNKDVINNEVRIELQYYM